MTKSEFLTTFFAMLNHGKIDYFVYGEYQSLPNDTGVSDIDMVVEENDVEKVKLILRNLTAKSSVCLASFYANANANALFYRFLSPEWGVQLDVFYKGLCYKGVEYYPTTWMKENVILHNGIKVLAKQKGFYVDFLKEILHNGVAKTKYRQAFLVALQTNEVQVIDEIRQLYGEQAGQLVRDNATDEGICSIERKLQRCMRRHLLKGNRLNVLMVKARLMLRLLDKPPGYVIAVEGTDGSGKSTIIDYVTPILNECFHNGIVYRHLRPSVLPDLGVLLGKKDPQEAGTVNTNPHGQKPSGICFSLIRWCYYLLDYTFGYMKSVWPQIHTKSKTFIFDRYYYDYYIDQLRTRTTLPQWVIRMGEWIVPKPDLILCLGGDPKKIYERKPEISLTEVTRQTEVLKAFCTKHVSAVWVDTTQTIEQSTKDAMAAVVRTLGNRFSYKLEK